MLLQDISCLLISGDDLEPYFSPLYHILDVVVLDINIIWLVMEHKIHWKLHTTLIVTIYHCGFQLLVEKSCKQLLNPHCFGIGFMGCNILFLCSVECDKYLLPTHPRYHIGAETEAYPWSNLPVISTPYPNRIYIFLKLYITIWDISQTIVHSTT